MNKILSNLRLNLKLITSKINTPIYYSIHNKKKKKILLYRGSLNFLPYANKLPPYFPPDQHQNKFIMSNLEDAGKCERR